MFTQSRKRTQRWFASSIVLVAWTVGFARAQSPLPAIPLHGENSAVLTQDPKEGPIKEGPTPVVPAPVPVVAAPGCTTGHCVAGRTKDCSGCGGSCGTRLLHGIYECICCPDPCYEPRWIAAANAAFFVDGTRPVTQTRLRWDAGLTFPNADRAEYFWARADGKGKGPGKVETNARYNELSLYQEVAAKGASAFVNVPYRSMDPDVNPHRAGFVDISVGAKSVILDCELLQIGLQFTTYLPSASPGKGLGTGHVSLEPSLLATLKLTSDCYLQTQLSEWIPLGGDDVYSGAVLHYHASLNTVLCRLLPDVPLIGTLEFNGYSFQDGAFTDSITKTTQRAGGDAFLSAGPGLRLVVCDKVDFGFGAAFGFDNNYGPEQLYRTEFRVRY